MNDPLARPNPPRLDSNRQLADVLERGNAEYQTGLDELAAFVRLSERLRAREPEGRRWQRGALAIAALACASLSAWWLSETAEPRVAFGPEASTARPGPTAGLERDRAMASGPSGDAPETAASEVTERGAWRDMERAEPLADDVEKASPRERGATLAPKQLPAAGGTARGHEAEALGGDSLERGALHQRSALPKSLDAHPGAPASAADGKELDIAGRHGSTAGGDCLELANQGEYRAAEQCFGERATGAGLSAEMALYEKARLRRDVLHDADGALSALDEYRTRFPQGSLRHEVNLSRVELLAELGRGREALRESEALLASPTGKERAAELHVLRGNVYRRDLADLRAADREYAQAEQLGGALGAEASQLRGAVLEALGDVPGALSAYRRYLSVTGQPRSADVSRRVERLSSSLAGKQLP